jgi:hypothetical protein
MKSMIMAFAACLLLPVSSSPSPQQMQEPFLIAAQLPRSAPEGEVKAAFVLNTSGEVRG